MARRKRAVGAVLVVLLVGVVSLLSGSTATASRTTRWTGRGRRRSGMPGAELVQHILGWGQWLGMAACAMVIIYGAATWHGFAGASAGRSVAGKTYVMAGGVGLLLIGLLPDDRRDAVRRRSERDR